MNISDIKTLLQNKRFDLHNEKILQSQIEQILVNSGIPYRREYELSKGSIIDFWIDNRLGIEIKIKGSPKDIFRQLRRYCSHDKIEAILLVTNKTIRLPQSIENKPSQVLNLGTSWL